MTDSADSNVLPRRVLVAQIGARMHYAVPRIFHDAGALGALHTDICAVKGWPSLCNRVIPNALRTPGMKRLFSRVPRGVPTRLIRTENDIGLSFALQLRRAAGATDETRIHLAAAERFCRRVVARGLDEFDCVYVFTSDGLEILEEAERRGVPAVVEQTIPPREIVVEMFESERRRFPDLVGERTLDGLWRDLAAREKREWELADAIFCGSQFVLDGVREVRGPVEKAVVVNYGVDAFPPSAPRRRGEGPAKVLFVGEVGFRKGSHYLIDAARKLGPDFVFRLCGKVVLPQSFLDRLPANVELLGIVPRAEMADQYRWADVFCLPSLLEGSATVTYEALAAGLPVVTTPNAGSIVRDGIDGFLVPPRDVDALAAALDQCRRREWPSDRPLLTDREGGPAAYSFEAYRERLLKAVADVCARRPAHLHRAAGVR